MNATNVLKNEHRLITLVLSAMGNMADEAEAAGRLNGEQADLALQFLRGFTDDCHHRKEEQHLFPALAPKGLTAQSGPVAVMLDEHVQGRALIKAMAESREQAAAGDPAQLAQFIQAARAYVALLSVHIDKENNVLFAMADQLLSAGEQEQLSAAFDRVEAEEMGEGTHQRFHEIGEELVKHYGVVAQESAANPQACAGCGCGHEH